MKFLRPTLFIFLSISIFYASAAHSTKFKLKIHKSKFKNQIIWALPEGIIDPKYSIEGDTFSAILSRESARKIRVPFGSRLMGEITEIDKARYLGRDDCFKIHVSTLLLPDGSSIEADARFEAKAKWEDYKDSSISKSIINSLVNEGSKLAAISAVGASDALIYGGIGTAIGTHGISIAIGAALGLGLGVYNAIIQPGDKLVNPGFYLMGLKAKSDFVLYQPLPLFSESIESFTASDFGIDMKVTKIARSRTKTFGDYLLVSLKLENRSPKDIYLSDLVLSSKNKIEPIFANPLLTNLKENKVESESKSSFRLAFNLGDLKRDEDYRLKIYDPIKNKSIADCEINISKYI
jgi:hypothetical protein